MDELHLNAVSSRKVGRGLPETCWPTAGTKGGKGLVKNRRHKEASELTEDASQPKRGTSTARARSANPEEVVLRALRHHAS